jgi:hypothetical protein
MNTECTDPLGERYQGEKRGETLEGNVGFGDKSSQFILQGFSSSVEKLGYASVIEMSRGWGGGGERSCLSFVKRSIL